MTKMDKPTHLSRRAVLKGAGALVVSVGTPLGVETLHRPSTAPTRRAPSRR